MSVYIITDIKVNDWDAYEAYVARTRPIVESYGGRYHVRGGEVTVRLGDWKPNRLIIIDFPSADDAAKFGNSPEYAPVKKIRETAADTLSSVMVEGYDGKSDNIGS